MRYIKLLPFVILSVSLFSCYSDPDPGIGIIVVKDQNEFRVPAAEVTLEQQGQNTNGIPFNVGYTDQNGEYVYSFSHPDTDEPVEVILNITAKKGSKTGQGVIRIKPGETTTEDVII